MRTKTKTKITISIDTLLLETIKQHVESHKQASVSNALEQVAWQAYMGGGDDNAH